VIPGGAATTVTPRYCTSPTVDIIVDRAIRKVAGYDPKWVFGDYSVGFLKRVARNKRLLMLRLYVDDSGKTDQSPVQILAGYLSTAERWAAFSIEWQELLDEAGLDAFRMAAAWRLARPYWNRGPLRRDRLIVQMVDCIKRHVEMAFVSSVPFEGFDRYLDMTQKPYSHPLGRPYFMGFFAILMQVYEHAFQYRADQRIDVIFEEQGGESERYVLSAMESFRRIASQRYGDLVIPTPTFQNDKDALPLQASDMLAWLVRRDAVNAARGIDRSQCLESLILGEALSMPNKIFIWSENRLALASRYLGESLKPLIESFEKRTAARS